MSGIVHKRGCDCCEVAEDYRADLARLRAQLAEAREVLRSVEWHGCVHHDGNSYPACLVCGKYHPDHAPDGRLAAQIPTEDT